MLKESKNFQGYIVFVLIFFVTLLFLDVLRPAEKQISVELCSQLVYGYKKVISPIFRSKIKCVYKIPCSDYAILSLKKYGFIKGVYLSIGRLIHCRQRVGPIEKWKRP